MQDLRKITRRFDPKDGFRIELHSHTSAASACSSIAPEDMAFMYKKAGYGGLVITDHFLTGNTCVDRTLPWDQQVDLFFEGYERAKVAGDMIGLRVFEGIEYSDYGTDFLLFGLERDFIKAHPEMTKMEPEEFLPFFHEAGAFIIQAHPFREASYVRQVRSYAPYVDAIEVINLGNWEAEYDRKAREEAERYGKPMTAGSDCHHFGDGYFGAGIILKEEPKDLAEICRIIGSGKGYDIFGGDR